MTKMWECVTVKKIQSAPCLTKELVYQATVTQTDKTTNTYIGLTSTTFKARLGVHKNSFKDPDANQTSLSNHIWDLKKKNLGYRVSWKLIDRAKHYSPVNGKCQLCIKEKFYILFYPEMATLNSKSEIYANCRHKRSKLLIKPKRKKKPHRRPGWKSYLSLSLSFSVSCKYPVKILFSCFQ